MHLQEYPGEYARALAQTVDLYSCVTSATLRVEKQSWGDKFVIWEEFMRPRNRKIGKTDYQKKLFRDYSGGGAIAPMDPPLVSAYILDVHNTEKIITHCIKTLHTYFDVCHVYR